jgi:hypothetical protein
MHANDAPVGASNYRNAAVDASAFEEKYLQERERAAKFEKDVWQLKAQVRAARLRRGASAIMATGGYGALFGTVLSAITHNCYQNSQTGNDSTMSLLAPAVIGLVLSIIAASVWQALREPGDKDFPPAPPPRTFG